MSTCISYFDTDKFILFFHHLWKLQSETHIYDDKLNFFQKVALTFPAFSSFCHAPILENDGAAFSSSSQTDFPWVGVLLLACNETKSPWEVVTFLQNFCLAQIKP